MKRIALLSLLFYAMACAAQTVGTTCTSTNPCVQVCSFGATSKTCTWTPASSFKGPAGPQGPPGPQIPGLTYSTTSTGTQLNLKGSFSQTALGTPTLILGNATCIVTWQTPTVGTISCKPSTVNPQ